MRKACIAGVLGALVALALGCGSSEKAETTAAPSPSATPAPAEAPQTGASPEARARRAKQPPAQITQGELPKDFPSDLPVYPDAQPRTSMMVGESGLVLFSSSASPADVLAHFREQLPSQGWTVDSVNEAAGGNKASVKAHKDARLTTISISKGKEGGTDIGIALKGSS